MNEQFPRANFLKNIEYYMDISNTRVGTLEKGIQVFPGYFSRLKNSEEKIPDVDVVWRIAKYFYTSIDALIERDNTAPNETINKLERFVKKLLDETISGKRDWIPVTSSNIDAVLRGERATETPPCLEQLFFEDSREYKMIEEDDDDSIGLSITGIEGGNYRIKSFALPDKEVWLQDSCFRSKINDDQWLWLTAYRGEFMNYSIKREDGSFQKKQKTFYEIVLENINDVTLLCSSLGQCRVLSPNMRSLYQEAQHHQYDFRMEPSTEVFIDNFLADRLNNDGIPF